MNVRVGFYSATTSGRGRPCRFSFRHKAGLLNIMFECLTDCWFLSPSPRLEKCSERTADYHNVFKMVVQRYLNVPLHALNVLKCFLLLFTCLMVLKVSVLSKRFWFQVFLFASRVFKLSRHHATLS